MFHVGTHGSRPRFFTLAHVGLYSIETVDQQTEAMTEDHEFAQGYEYICVSLGKAQGDLCLLSPLLHSLGHHATGVLLYVEICYNWAYMYAPFHPLKIHALIN